MISLQELSESLSRDVVKVRAGKELEIRALSAAETSVLGRVFPRPLAPTIPGLPGKPPIENELDAGYQEKFAQWFWQRKVLEVGLSCGFIQKHDLSTPDPAASLRDHAAQIEKALTQPEIQRVWEKTRSIFDRGKDEQIREALIVDAAKHWEELALAGVMNGGDEWKLPEKYHQTALYAALCMCERCHIDPRTLDATDPGMLRILLAHHRYRLQEEA